MNNNGKEKPIGVIVEREPYQWPIKALGTTMRVGALKFPFRIWLKTTAVPKPI